MLQDYICILYIYIVDRILKTPLVGNQLASSAAACLQFDIALYTRIIWGRENHHRCHLRFSRSLETLDLSGLNSVCYKA